MYIVALLFAALAWAVFAPNSHYFLRMYFAAQLIYLPVVWSAYYLTGGQSPVYTFIYSLFTFGILAVVLAMTYESLRKPRRTIVLVSLALALAVAFLARMELRDSPPAISAQMVESFVLALCGTAMGLSARSNEHPMIPVTLSLLWLAQATMRLGFVLHMPQTEWLVANQWIPPWLVITATGWIGYSLRRQAT